MFTISVLLLTGSWCVLSTYLMSPIRYQKHCDCHWEWESDLRRERQVLHQAPPHLLTAARKCCVWGQVSGQRGGHRAFFLGTQCFTTGSLWGHGHLSQETPDSGVSYAGDRLCGWLGHGSSSPGKCSYCTMGCVYQLTHPNTSDHSSQVAPHPNGAEGTSMLGVPSRIPHPSVTEPQMWDCGINCIHSVCLRSIPAFCTPAPHSHPKNTAVLSLVTRLHLNLVRRSKGPYGKIKLW